MCLTEVVYVNQLRSGHTLMNAYDTINKDKTNLEDVDKKSIASMTTIPFPEVE